MCCAEVLGDLTEKLEELADLAKQERETKVRLSCGRHLILELENFRANLGLQFYRFTFIFKSNTFFWETEALHIQKQLVVEI